MRRIEPLTEIAARGKESPARPRAAMRQEVIVLALSRKSGEGILIGNDIHIVISEIRGNKVIVAIDAPDEVEILRDELVLLELPTASMAKRPGAA